jgi:hypothetical protein
MTVDHEGSLTEQPTHDPLLEGGVDERAREDVI